MCMSSEFLACGEKVCFGLNFGDVKVCFGYEIRAVGRSFAGLKEYVIAGMKFTICRDM